MAESLSLKKNNDPADDLWRIINNQHRLKKERVRLQLLQMKATEEDDRKLN